jgi:hypothetical protein
MSRRSASSPTALQPYSPTALQSLVGHWLAIGANHASFRQPCELFPELNLGNGLRHWSGGQLSRRAEREGEILRTRTLEDFAVPNGPKKRFHLSSGSFEAPRYCGEARTVGESSHGWHQCLGRVGVPVEPKCPTEPCRCACAGGLGQGAAFRCGTVHVWIFQ